MLNPLYYIYVANKTKCLKLPCCITTLPSYTWQHPSARMRRARASWLHAETASLTFSGSPETLHGNETRSELASLTENEHMYCWMLEWVLKICTLDFVPKAIRVALVENLQGIFLPATTRIAAGITDQCCWVMYSHPSSQDLKRVTLLNWNSIGNCVKLSQQRIY